MHWQFWKIASYHLHPPSPHQAEVQQCPSVATTQPKLHTAGFNYSELVKIFFKDEANSGRGEGSPSAGGPPPPPPGGRSGPPPPPPVPEREARQGSQNREPIFRWLWGW